MRTLIFTFVLVSISLTASNAGGQDKPRFELCDRSNVYRIDDSLLAEKGYASAPIVQSNPQFGGGAEALQKFFDENLKLDEEPKNVFGRIHIAFIVNCKGKVGDFKLISKVFPDMAQDIIKVGEKMPDWEAGKAKDKEVDTYAKLSFTISQGRAKVSMKK
jgi:hypothetical protein